MILSKKVSNIEMLISKDELTYGRVLDDFKNATFIDILTFNISEKRNQLLNAIKECPNNPNVTVITNIPKRFDTYFGEKYAQGAKTQINIYKNKLDPEKISEKAQTFFCFSNHSKIIVTDNIAYVGSANYSEESAQNFEAGFISTDKDYIAFLHEEVFPWVIESSSEYETDEKLLLLETSLYNCSTYLERVYSSLHDNLYLLSDHRGKDYWFYNDSYDTLSVSLLNEIYEVSTDMLELVNSVDDLLSLPVFDNLGVRLEESYNISVNKTVDVISELLWGKIRELAQFSKQSYTEDYLSDHYADAYDEMLDYYVDKASEAANDAFTDLAQAAKDESLKLLNKLNELCHMEEILIDKYKSIPKNKIVIDNT